MDKKEKQRKIIKFEYDKKDKEPYKDMGDETSGMEERVQREMDNKIHMVIDNIQLDRYQDNRIISSILEYKNGNDSRSMTNIEGKDEVSSNQRLHERLYQKYGKHMIKIAVALLVLLAIGGGTAIASTLSIFKAKSLNMTVLTEKEHAEMFDTSNIEYSHYVERNMKVYGIKDTTKIEGLEHETPIMNDELDEFLTGPKTVESFEYDTAKLAGDAAFAEVNMPNLISDYLYDEYYLASPGFVYDQVVDTFGLNSKRVMVHFSKLGHDAEFNEKRVIVSYDNVKFLATYFTEKNQSDKNQIEDKFNATMYTTKNGIECEIVKYDNSASVILVFDSEEHGEGSLSFSFIGTSMDEIETILDKIPFLGSESIPSNSVE